MKQRSGCAKHFKNWDKSGTDVLILKIFSKKQIAKIGVLTQNKAKLCKILIITLVFEKNANFSPKIVIITSTPGARNLYVQ
jgi:hypothetical protein